jgi:AcrR family transcriptional regulator
LVTLITASESEPQLGLAGEVRFGRKRDHSRDGDILDATLDVLAEKGYDGMTIDMVAARAKAGKATLYRRWSSKGDLVVNAVVCMKKALDDSDNLPDTGTFRGDLLAMIQPRTILDAEKRFQVMWGVASMVTRSPELAEAVNAAIIEPSIGIGRRLLRRAVERGEIAAECDIDAVAEIGPAMMAYHVLVLRQPMNREFFIRQFDGVILPAVGLGSRLRVPR